jgi:hypothetical protein
MLAVHQLSPDLWPKGHALPLAVIPEEPNQLLGLTFYRSHDDLGEVLIAVIETVAGRRFGLLRYTGSPTRGTGVYVVPEEGGMPAALAALESVLEVQRDYFVWIAPSALQSP